MRRVYGGNSLTKVSDVLSRARLCSVKGYSARLVNNREFKPVPIAWKDVISTLEITPRYASSLAPVGSTGRKVHIQ
jgi:hypothetical protein